MPDARPTQPAQCVRPGPATLAAFLLPFAAYAWTASNHAYWLDSAEFTAAAVDLDIAHPPGHPLSGIWGGLFTFLPVGSLAYRVALSQAAAAAIAVAALELAFARTMAFLSFGQGLRLRGASLGLALILAASHAYWFQAVRPEVYALQAALVCLALERMVHFATLPQADDARPLFAACMALGFGLANHHLIALLALPALGHGVLRSLRAQGPRVLLPCVGAGALGLSTYVYLPLRAQTDPAMDLGHPTTAESMWWVISAQVYARNMGAEAVQPLSERLADSLVLAVDNLSLPLLMLAFVGWYAMVRVPRSWALAYVWTVAAGVSFGVRAWLGPVRDNPDILGYLLPGFGAVVGLGSAGLAAIGAALEVKVDAAKLRTVLAAGTMLWAAVALPSGAARSSLLGFHAPDDVDDLRRRTLSPRAVLFLTTPEPVFSHWKGEAEEHLRADLQMIPLPFLDYGPRGQRLREAHPALSETLLAYERSGRLSLPALRRLADSRPVLIEADTRLAPPLFPSLLPDGLLYRVRQARPDPTQLHQAFARRKPLLTRLRTQLGADLREPETRRQLVWIHYVDALYWAFHGFHPAARWSITQCLTLAPQSRHAKALARAIPAADAAPPLDIRPFLLRD